MWTSLHMQSWENTNVHHILSLRISFVKPWLSYESLSFSFTVSFATKLFYAFKLVTKMWNVEGCETVCMAKETQFVVKVK